MESYQKRPHDVESLRKTRNAINRETGKATGLPNHTYTNSAFFEIEQQQLFAQTWTCIAHACSVPEPGDLKPVSWMGVPLLLCRDENSTLRVFHNVCSHRGNELVWNACSVTKRIACPYHGWSYGLDGELKTTPNIGGNGVHQTKSLDPTQHGLKLVRSMVWMDLVFVNLSGEAPPFDTHIEPLQRRINKFADPDQFAQLRPSLEDGRLTIKFNANWKLAVENNLDAYHLPLVHPNLNAVSRFEDHYDYVEDGLFAGQGTENYDHTQIDGLRLKEFSGWPDRKAEYPTLYPNVFFGLHQDHFWTRIVEPVSVDETLDHLQIYYLGDVAVDAQFAEMRKIRLDTWAEVFKEDIEVVEGMQRGRTSPAFDGGLFSDVLDTPSHHFAKWIANKLL